MGACDAPRCSKVPIHIATVKIQALAHPPRTTRPRDHCRERCRSVSGCRGRGCRHVCRVLLRGRSHHSEYARGSGVELPSKRRNSPSCDWSRACRRALGILASPPHSPLLRPVRSWPDRIRRPGSWSGSPSRDARQDVYGCWITGATLGRNLECAASKRLRRALGRYPLTRSDVAAHIRLESPASLCEIGAGFVGASDVLAAAGD